MYLFGDLDLLKVMKGTEMLVAWDGICIFNMKLKVCRFKKKTRIKYLG